MISIRSTRRAGLLLASILFLIPGLSFAENAAVASKEALTFIRTAQLPTKETAAQTLSAEYRPSNGNGPSIWLIGVAHLGSAEYYKSIQDRLNQHTVVLYEGVNGGRLKEGAEAAPNDGGIQAKLAKALGLVFQLDAIDYRRPNFINSDLSGADLAKEIDKRAGRDTTPGQEPKKDAPNNPDAPASNDAAGSNSLPSGTDNETFNSLMDALQGTGQLGEQFAALTDLIGSSPEMRETTKVMLVEALGQAGEMIEVAKNMSPDMRDLFEVVLSHRNEVVIRDIRAQLEKLKPTDTIAVFYGAAHMDEIAQSLAKDLAYTSTAQHWDTAFTADPSKSFMQPAQIRMLLQAFGSQVKKAKEEGRDPLEQLNGAPLQSLFGPIPAKKPAPAK